MDEEDKLNKLQEFLLDAYVKYVAARRRKVSDNQFAKYLGVSTASYNSWINGNRLPSYDNCIKIANRLGPEIFTILGYEPVTVSGNPEIMFITEHWRDLDSETRQQILDHIKEELQKRARRS